MVDSSASSVTGAGRPRHYDRVVSGIAVDEVHPTAIVHTGAVLGEGVSIGPFSIVHDDVRIGPGTTIGSHCEIGTPSPLAEGRPLVIGSDSVVRSHVVIYAGSTFGDRLETGHHVTMREGLTAGQNLRVGTLSDLQGDATIGDYVRLHSNVHVGKLSKIGDFVWIFPYTVLTNDPHPPSEGHHVGVTVEDFAVVSTLVCVAPGVTVGRAAVVGASSMVTKDVESGALVMGVPAKPFGDASRVLLRDGTGRSAYPWTSHFSRGYPAHVVESWAADVDEDAR